MNEMYLVGNLQDYGGPYSSLFINKEEGSLYILVRAKNNYLVTSVSAEDIADYMNGSKNLLSLFRNKESSEAILNGKQFRLTQTANLDIASMIREEDIFDPDFCFDKMKLKVFLKRFNAGAYIPKRMAN